MSMGRMIWLAAGVIVTALLGYQLAPFLGIVLPVAFLAIWLVRLRG